MSFPDEIRWRVENQIQASLSTVIEEKDEVMCRRYWVNDLEGKRNWLVFHFEDGHISIVPEGGTLGDYAIVVQSSTQTARDSNDA